MKRSCVIPGKVNPGPRGPVAGLKGANFVVALQRQCDLVEALQKTGAPARIDLEAMHLPRWRGDRLLFEIDSDAARALAVLDFHGEGIDNLLVDHDRQDAVLEAVGEKDIAKARSDNGANAFLLKRPYRAFTRRPATEIRTGDKHLRVSVRLAVQDEGGILRPIRQITQRTERP